MTQSCKTRAGQHTLELPLARDRPGKRTSIEQNKT